MLDSLARIGGAEGMAIETCAGLAEDGFRTYLCLTRWDPDLRRIEPAASRLARLEAAGTTVIGLPRRSRADVRPWRRMTRLLREERIDVLHSHMFGSNAWGSVIARLASTPVMVAHEHMWSFEGSYTRRLIDRHVIGRFADAVVAVSADARRRMIEVEGIPDRKVVLIRNGVPPLPEAAREAARGELGIPQDRLVVVSTGHLRPEKAFDCLLEAVAIVAPRFPAITVLIAGEGPERGNLEGLVAELGLADRVHLLGYRADVPDLLAAADVCVCCSDYEGGPLSVMEYMTAGKPVVATDAGGLPELVEHERTGLLVGKRDSAALASALDRLLRDPALRRRLGEHGRQRALRDFSFERSLAETRGLYERLARGKGLDWN